MEKTEEFFSLFRWIYDMIDALRKQSKMFSGGTVLKRKSHLNLGKRLSFQYFNDPSRLQRGMFLIGCMQPDWNPTTYLKGSRTYAWLRGHNYNNARRYMERLAERLEHCEKWGAFNYYRLGKLIHYITDAFTQAHNAWFAGDLSVHRDYENALQEHFLARLEKPWHPRRELLARSETIAELINRTHLRYEGHGGDCITDARYVFAVATEVLARLFAQQEAEVA